MLLSWFLFRYALPVAELRSPLLVLMPQDVIGNAQGIESEELKLRVLVEEKGLLADDNIGG